MSADAPSRALVLYASTHGHTEKVAGRISEVLDERGLDVDLRRAGEGDAPDPGAYDLVVAGGSLHIAKHQPELVEWATANAGALTDMPSAFFSVSLTAADDTDEAREATRACIDEFVEETGWTPLLMAAVAGSLQYREYDVFTRTLMKLKMRAGGHPADTSTDHEFTDWDALDAFAGECVDAVAKR